YGLWFTPDNKLNFAVDTGNAIATVISPDTITDTGIWHLVTGTYTSNDMRLYVDGFSVASTTSLSGNVNPGNTNPLTIAARTSNTPNYFNGTIDDVRIYNYALSPSDVARL